MYVQIKAATIMELISTLMKAETSQKRSGPDATSGRGREVADDKSGR